MGTARINLVAYEGDSFERRLRWMQGSPAVGVDLTDYAGLMRVRPAINSPEVLFELTTENGGFVIPTQTGDDIGAFSLVIDKEDIEEKCPNHTNKEWVYGAVLTAPDGTRKTKLEGTFTIKASVPRPWIV